MLNLNELKPQAGSRKNKTRVGRGTGSGLGHTSGRGNNGQKSRSGYSRKIYFEGGQLPIIKRLPKRGFTNIFRKEIQVINLREIADLVADNAVIDAKVLFNAGKIRSIELPVKVLAEGSLDKAVTIKADAFSAGAVAKIAAANGTAEVISRA